MRPPHPHQPRSQESCVWDGLGIYLFVDNDPHFPLNGRLSTGSRPLLSLLITREWATALSLDILWCFYSEISSTFSSNLLLVRASLGCLSCPKSCTKSIPRSVVTLLHLRSQLPSPTLAHFSVNVLFQADDLCTQPQGCLIHSFPYSWPQIQLKSFLLQKAFLTWNKLSSFFPIVPPAQIISNNPSIIFCGCGHFFFIEV